MKYKKRSLKKKRQRHRFSKKYASATVQRGGGFMDTIAEINAMEGRTHTCMAVHPTQPLVAVGDDAGTVTLWEINQPQPKRVAQLMGLPQTAVKYVEFHPTIPVVAAACSDIILMWRIDQINREQQQDQQVQPSHTVSDFTVRNIDVVEKEYDEAERILEEEHRNKKHMEKELETLNSRNWQIIGEIEKLKSNIEEYKLYIYNHNRRGEQDKVNEYRDKLKDQESRLLNLQEEIKSIEKQRKILDKRHKEIDIWGKEKIVKEKDAELKKIQKGARDEVSCFSFHTRKSYIAVGVNNDILKKVNRVNMYEFKIEPSSSVQLLYSLYLSSERFIPSEKVLFTSFSSDGQLLSFVTLKQNGTTVLQVINFKGPNNTYAIIEIGSYEIKKKCSCIAPYRTSVGYHNGRYYKFAGMMRTHGFIIGCDDGSLMLIDAVTIYVNDLRLTRVEAVRQSKEWNTGEAIECVAVHPSSLPLFASGSRNAVQLWDVIQREPEPLVVQPQITPVGSVGFNQNFLAVCGPGGVRVYSCNSNDYDVYKKILQNESNALGEFNQNVMLANRRGDDCIICGESMNDPLSQPAIRSGESEEIYLTCGHKFHNNDSCINKWIKKGGKCPLCKQTSDFEVGTPERILKLRNQAMTERMAASIIGNNEQRFMRALDYGGPISQGSPLRLIRYRNLVQPQASDIASSAPEDVVEDAPLASSELTPNRLRAARLAYFSQQQQQSPSVNRGGSKQNKYSRKKYSSKKSKIRNYYTSSKKHKKYS
jgi:WD40 repeat protein